MQLEVYQTDAEVYEAASALAAERLTAAAATGRATVAVPGGRGGRALMLALAARGDVPWQRLEVFFTDECCVPDGDARSTLHLARESLLGPRGVPAARVHPIPVGGGDPARAAAAYAEVLAREVGVPPVLDLVLLDLGAGGEIAALMAGSNAARSASTVAAVEASQVTLEPRLARITLTGAALRSARHVIVTATGAERAGALAAALREPADPPCRPAQAVLPSAMVSWFVDRAAAEPLLRDAHPAPGSQ